MAKKINDKSSKICLGVAGVVTVISGIGYLYGEGQQLQAGASDPVQIDKKVEESRTVGGLNREVLYTQAVGGLAADTIELSVGQHSYEIMANELMVQFNRAFTVEQVASIAESLGSTLLSQGKYSGIVRLERPRALSLEQFQFQLASMPEVEGVTGNAVMVGASRIEGDLRGANKVQGEEDKEEKDKEEKDKDDDSEVDEECQDSVNCTGNEGSEESSMDDLLGEAPHWNLAQIGLFEALSRPAEGLRGVKIAVLDTGAAYADGIESGVEHLRAKDFEHIQFQEGYDFINDDDRPFDDHMHGSHITGIIAGDGYAKGVAAGVQIIPVKVLDAHMRGTEAALIEGIYFAVAQGADVLNMSLSFGLGYYPSAPLQEAIAFAVDSGVLIVSSTGNHGARGVAYPAAFPQVMAIGSGWRESQGNGGSMGRSLYSDHGNAIDMLAPGGQFEEDWDSDGLPDGIVASAFKPEDPSTIGHWMVVGTSQAAAHISGAAAWLIADGEDSVLEPELLISVLRGSAHTSNSNKIYEEVGAGLLQLPDARGLLSDFIEGRVERSDILPPDYQVNLFGWLEPGSSEDAVQAHVRAQVIDEEGLPVSNVYLGGSFFGSLSDFDVLVETDKDGLAEIVSQDIEAEQGVAVGFQVDMIRESKEWVSSRPTQFYSLSPALAEVLSQVSVDETLRESALLWRLDDGNEALWQQLGVVNAIPGFSATPVGPGFVTGPMVLMLDEEFVPELVEFEEEGHLPRRFDFPSALLSGEGMIDGVSGHIFEGEIAQLGGAARFVLLPPDLAMFDLDLQRYYPVLNARTALYLSKNEAFGDGFASSSLGAGFASSSMGAGFASSSLGDGFASSSLGAGFASSSLGAGFASSSMGAGFASSSMGAAFASSSMGAGFASSSMGASLEDSPENAELVASQGGCTVYQFEEGEKQVECVESLP